MEIRNIYISLTLLLIICLVLAFPSPGQAEWDTFHGDPARTGYSDTDYIAGDLLWERELGNGYIDTSPIMVGDRVFVISAGDAGADSTVHCLDAETGDTIWETTIPGKTYQLSTPVFAKGRLYFGSSSGVFYCLVEDDGSILWQRPLDESSDGITSSPAFDEPSGDLYVGTGDGTLYNLELGTGNTIWSFDTGATIYFSSPAVYGDLVIIGNDDGTLFGVREGAEVWSYETEDSIRSSACVTDTGTIYFSSEDGMLRSLSSQGVQNWENHIGRSISTPAFSNGKVYVGSETGLHAFHEDGSLDFSIETQSPVESSPSISDHQIFFIENSNNGELISADLQGNIIWSSALEEYALSSPGLGEATLFAASDNSKIWCFHSTDPEYLILNAEPVPEVQEGERTLLFQGYATYDTGRPASGIDIEVRILDRTFSGSTTSKGSFSVNGTIDLVPGNHTATIHANDGTFTNETSISVLVTGDSESPGESGNSDEFISGFIGPVFLVGVSLAAIARKRRI